MRSYHSLRLFFFVIALLSCPSLWGQQSYQLYVHDTQLLVAPNPPISNAALNKTAWASRHSSVTVVKDGSYAARATVNSYFTGIAEIQCDYYYYYYINGRMYTGNATTYYTIRCKSVNITLSDSSLSMTEGDTHRLSFSYSPSNVSPQPTMRWSSSNTNVATVNNSGNITAKSEGQCYVELSNDMGPSAQCLVRVKKKPIPATRISVSPQTAKISQGVTKLLSYTLEPTGATSSVTWESEDKTVATVSSEGSVLGKGIGETRIIARTDNGLESYASIIVTTGIQEISLKQKKDIYLGFSCRMEATWEPEDVETQLNWSSSDTSIATIDKNGVLTSKKAGIVTITVRTDNGKSAKTQVTIKPLKSSISITGISNKAKSVKETANQLLSK